MCFQMGSEKWQGIDHPNRVGQLIPQSSHCHRETAVTVPDGLREWLREFEYLIDLLCQTNCQYIVIMSHTRILVYNDAVTMFYTT